MFVRTEDEPGAIGRAWERLEALVSLRGRKFFGAFDPSTRDYRACVQLQEGDDPARSGWKTGVLPGGLSRTGTYSLVYAGELLGITLMFYGFTWAGKPQPAHAPSSAAAARAR